MTLGLVVGVPLSIIPRTPFYFCTIYFVGFLAAILAMVGAKYFFSNVGMGLLMIGFLWAFYIFYFFAAIFFGLIGSTSSFFRWIQIKSYLPRARLANKDNLDFYYSSLTGFERAKIYLRSGNLITFMLTVIVGVIFGALGAIFEMFR